MDSVSKATKTQIENIQSKTAKTLDELSQMAKQNGLEKHGEIRKFMIDRFQLGYGDANLIATYVRNPKDPAFQAPESVNSEQLIAQIYSGPKEKFFEIHKKIMDEITSFGDFTISPKKSNVSLRRKRQFALIGPATNTRFEVGINLKDQVANSRLNPQPKGSMCDYVVILHTVDEVDAPLIEWMRMAYDQAG